MSAPTFVYFVRPIGRDGPVKIGCSIDPEVRLATHGLWSPEPLEIAATIQVEKRSVEGRFHSAFRHLHTHHEWFRADPALTAVIDAVRAGTFDVTTLPPTTQLYRAHDYWTDERREAHGLALNAGRAEMAAGVRKPERVRDAIFRLSSGQSANRAADVALVRSFIADPLRDGHRYDHAWAVAAREKYIARRKAA